MVDKFQIINKDEDSLDVAREIEQHYNEMMNMEIEIPKRKQFMPSNFPYCPVLEIDYYFNPKEKECTGFMPLFYTRCGSQIHDVIQNMLPITNNKEFNERQLGSWECDICHKKWGADFPIPRPDKEIVEHNKKCRGNVGYKEINFRYKNLNAYTDNLFKIGNYYVLKEYKTVGAKYINDPRYMKYLPFKSHVHQIESYGPLLKKCYGIVPKYYVIIYISRDPAKDSLISVGIIKKYTKQILKQRWVEIKRGNKGFSCVKSIKMSRKEESIKAKLKKLLKLKPCTCKKDFNGYMKDAFFFTETCPFLKDDMCFNNKTMLKHLMKLIMKHKSKNKEGEK